MSQQTIERSLNASTAQTLDIVRNNAGINNYQAFAYLGRSCLTQRVSDLSSMGFQFATEYREYIDPNGNPHRGVAHYTLLGWRDPRVQDDNKTLDKPEVGISTLEMGVQEGAA